MLGQNTEERDGLKIGETSSLCCNESTLVYRRLSKTSRVTKKSESYIVRNGCEVDFDTDIVV